MTLTEFLTDAKKAIGALVVGEAAAVSAGLIGNETAGLVTGALGVASAVVVYLLPHDSKPKP